MRYRYYRNSLIKFGILSLGGLGIFWDYFTGQGPLSKDPGAPGVLIFVAALVVFGNVWLFVKMMRAKRDEQAFPETLSEAPLLFTLTPLPPGQVLSPSDAARERKAARRFMSWLCVIGGPVLMVLGSGRVMGGVPIHWVGAGVVLLGILAFAGFNVFRGGPLDLRLDVDEEREPAE